MTFELLEKLRHDAPDRPNVCSWAIVFLNQNYFGRSIPPGDYMIRKSSLMPLLLPVKLYQHLFNLAFSFFLSHLLLTILSPCSIDLLQPILNTLQGLKRIDFQAEDASSKAEIADLNVTIFIYQNIRRLDVPVKNLSLVDPLQSTKQVIDYHLHM